MSLETISTISPATNEPVVTRTGVSSEELKQIPVAAQTAFRSFSQSTTLEQRQQIVERALDILEKKQDELAREITEQMGRPIAYTGVEVATAIKRSRYLVRISSSVLGEKGTVPGEEENGFRRYIKRSPVGVALIIFPWNVSLIREDIGISVDADKSIYSTPTLHLSTAWFPPSSLETLLFSSPPLRLQQSLNNLPLLLPQLVFLKMCFNSSTADLSHLSRPWCGLHW
jgi:NAD-dependent aldehyde dehydrogenases